jgi:hypothetical protein
MFKRMSQIRSVGLLALAFLGLFVFSEAEVMRPDQKPAIILVPAAFSKATVYDQVKGKLSSSGYHVVVVDLCSVSRGAEHVDRTPDIRVIQWALGRQINQGKKAILVGNRQVDF